MFSKVCEWSHVLYFILSLPFLFLTYQSTRRYFLYQTSVSIVPSEMKDKVFPSISICPKYAYKDWFRVFNFNDTKLLKPKLYSHIWKRNETFYYVDYPNKNNSGFECMTEKSSSDPGKPCRFPYNHVDDPNISIQYIPNCH